MYETTFKLKEHTALETASAIQMKTFIDHDPVIVENRINDWLASHNVRISHVGQSQSEKSGRFVFVVSVFYR
jgi:hypothetical protein